MSAASQKKNPAFRMQFRGAMLNAHTPAGESPPVSCEEEKRLEPRDEMRHPKPMSNWLDSREVDSQLAAFGTILHFRRIPAVLIEKCLLPGWQLDRPDRNPHATLEWEPHALGRGALRLLAEGQTASDTRVSWESLPIALDQSLHLAIAEFSPQAVFLHAGVTVWNSAAILIPGRSHSGKSTLTKALIDAGALYYSDEFAPVLPDGQVVPYPKPLSLRASAKSPGLAGKNRPPAAIDPTNLGWQPSLPPVHVAIIAAVAYHPDDPEPRPKIISRAEAAASLLNNTISMLNAPERAMAAASRVSRNALCFGGARPEAARFAQELLHILSVSDAPAPVVNFHLSPPRQ